MCQKEEEHHGEQQGMQYAVKFAAESMSIPKSGRGGPYTSRCGTNKDKEE